jgi:hypothetical protein
VQRSREPRRCRTRQPARGPVSRRAGRGASRRGSDAIGLASRWDNWWTEPRRNPTKRGACCRIVEARNPGDLQGQSAETPRFRSACHAEGRGFESLQPLPRSPRLPAASAPSSPRHVSGWEAFSGPVDGRRGRRGARRCAPGRRACGRASSSAGAVATRGFCRAPHTPHWDPVPATTALSAPRSPPSGCGDPGCRSAGSPSRASGSSPAGRRCRSTGWRPRRGRPSRVPR